MRSSSLRTALLATGWLVVACSSSGPAGGAQPSSSSAAEDVKVGDPALSGVARPDRMLRLVLRLTADGAAIVSTTEAPNTVNRRDPLHREATFFRALDDRGELLLERGFRLPLAISGERRDPAGQLDGVHAPLEDPVFTIAVPSYRGLSLIRLYRESAAGTRENPVLLGEVRP